MQKGFLFFLLFSASAGTALAIKKPPIIKSLIPLLEELSRSCPGGEENFNRCFLPNKIVKHINACINTLDKIFPEELLEKTLNEEIRKEQITKQNLYVKRAISYIKLLSQHCEEEQTSPKCQKDTQIMKDLEKLHDELGTIVGEKYVLMSRFERDEGPSLDSENSANLFDDPEGWGEPEMDPSKDDLEGLEEPGTDPSKIKGSYFDKNPPQSKEENKETIIQREQSKNELKNKLEKINKTIKEKEQFIHQLEEHETIAQEMDEEIQKNAQQEEELKGLLKQLEEAKGDNKNINKLKKKIIKQKQNIALREKNGLGTERLERDLVNLIKIIEENESELEKLEQDLKKNEIEKEKIEAELRNIILQEKIK